MNVILGALLAYIINLASNERSSAIGASRERKLKEAFEQEEALKKALASTHSIRDEVRRTCIELAGSRTRLGVTPQEEPVWRLLSDDTFQADLAEWLMAGAIEEGNAAKERLLRAMELALSDAGASAEQITFLRTAYFDALNSAVSASPILGHWRHQLSIDYLREQVVVLRRRAEEAAGVFSPEKQKAALDRYCEKALIAWDIIDLSNLPEGDIHMAIQKLLLRQLYMPLRIEVEPSKQGEGDDSALARLEQDRDARRRREAGHLLTTDEPDRPECRKPGFPVGECLAASPRLVVLGDPGAGKTTMLRWMATAYLLRHGGDAAFRKLPDTQTLPGQPWIPVLIRCRDLGESDLCRCFTDFLTQHLNKTELLPEEAEVMRAVLLDRIAKGEALLLVDGLDEITNPRVRTMFCQELERTAARYPDTPIVVTSRIVGYRDMPHRMGSGFEHGQIAELNRDDKDLFAHRWVEVTEQHQSTEEKAKRAQELLDALHSSDRIERLTGNPMLLTTLVLVKRKVGKLPNKRNKLYAEAVSVLLNWNSRLYQTIEEDEAIPQLEYLAYEMCRRGVQRLADDEVLDLLDKLRAEYPNIRAIKRREAQAFLKDLEERSSVLIKSGGIWQRNTKQETPIWEFRHLTFQEYLAARALLDGRYPGRDKAKTLAQQVALLAGAVQQAKSSLHSLTPEGEVEVPESWREALRLLLADCKDDDVDEALLAILNPLDGEDARRSARPRAVLAALCLADEPNVAELTAEQALARFASLVDAPDGSVAGTAFDRAALEVGASLWWPTLKKHLAGEFCRRPPATRGDAGGLLGIVGWHRLGVTPQIEFGDLLKRLESSDRAEAITGALLVMMVAYEGKAAGLDGLAASLMALLEKDGAEGHAAAWALVWLSGAFDKTSKKRIWVPSEVQLDIIIAVLDGAPTAEISLKRFLVHLLGTVPRQKCLTAIIPQLDETDEGVRLAVVRTLGQLGDKQAVEPLLAKLDDQNIEVRKAVVEVLGQLGDKQAVEPLLAKLDDQNAEVRKAVVEVLGQLGDKQAVRPLLAKLNDSDELTRAIAGAALHALGEPKGTAAMNLLLASNNFDTRQFTIRGLAQLRDDLDQRLLSRDLDAASPWLDSQKPVTQAQVAGASIRLNLTPDEVRSRYEAMATDWGLKLAWKS